MNKIKDENCIFCKIADGVIPSYKVYEDEDFLAFLDVNPCSKGHTLVICKEHYKNFVETPKEVMNKQMNLAQRIAKAQLEVLKADGVNILSNVNEAAGQSVMHFHIHVIPRYKGETVDFNAPKANVSKDEMVEIASLLNKNI